MQQAQVEAESASAQEQSNKFDHLCGNANSSLLLVNSSVQEMVTFSGQLMKFSIPPKLLAQLTVLTTKLFRNYSDLCIPVGELIRMVRLYSKPLEKDSDLLKKLRQDNLSKQRQLEIALKKIGMMAAENERTQHEKRVMNWQKLFISVMATRSHGYRWKFRIEPLRKKMEKGYFNPYASDSSDDEAESKRPARTAHAEESTEDELLNLKSQSNSDVENEMDLLDMTSFKNKLSDISQKRFQNSEPQSEVSSAAELMFPVTSEVAVPPVTHISTTENTTWTGEPHYDNYLYVQVFRPAILPGVDLCCTLSLGQQLCSTDVFVADLNPDGPTLHQDFHFSVSSDAARTLPPELEEPINSVDVPTLNIAVYPRAITEEMIAHCCIPLNTITMAVEPTVLAPPQDKEELERPFEIDWEHIGSSLTGIPVEYALAMASDEGDPGVIPLLCHRIKVARHMVANTGTGMVSWEDLLLELGYQLIPDMTSRAVSALNHDNEQLSSKEIVTVEKIPEDCVSQKEVAEMTLLHVEEMIKLQDQYEQRLKSLSENLTKLKREKAQEVEQLEQALIAAEESQGRKVKSLSDIRKLMAQKQRPKVNQKLPDWGSNIPEDFFERLELFAMESLIRQTELTERVRREVSEACEKQLASQHRLAHHMSPKVDPAADELSLPAIFMPTKNNVYSPRAHNYFHPSGSSQLRVTQPPSVFKLPALPKDRLPTLNLYDLSQHFPITGPNWLRETPQFTPAPPPSSCGFYVQQKHTPES